MTGGEWLICLGGVMLGFGLGDLYHYLNPPERPQRTVAEGWDEIQHVRIVNRRTK